MRNIFILLLLAFVAPAFGQIIKPKLPGPLLGTTPSSSSSTSSSTTSPSNTLFKEATEKSAGARLLIIGSSYAFNLNTAATQQALFAIGDPSINSAAKAAEKLKNGDFKEQTDVYKALLFASKNSAVRQAAIDDAYRQVYGREANPTEYAYWDATLVQGKKDWYTTMVAANTAKLNADKDAKTIAVQAAFVTVFGRMPTAAEQEKWVSGKSHYQNIYQSLLSYMYSADGATDLTETVKRTFTRNKQSYTSEQLKQRMMTAKAGKMDFMKMVASF